MENNSNFNFLNLRPTHCLCPYCGKWHKYKEGTAIALKHLDRKSDDTAQVACSEMPSFYSQYCDCQVSFETTKKRGREDEFEDFSIELTFLCECPRQPEQLTSTFIDYWAEGTPFTRGIYSNFCVVSWHEKLPAKSVVASLKRPVITFNSNYFVTFDTKKSLECYHSCKAHVSECAACKLGLAESGWGTEMQLKLGFAFDPYEYADVMGINFHKIKFDPNTDEELYI